MIQKGYLWGYKKLYLPKGIPSRNTKSNNDFHLVFPVKNAKTPSAAN